MNRIRPARTAEAKILSDLAFRSKASWGYDDAFMATCRPELTISRHYVRTHPVFVIEDHEALLGFYSLTGRPPELEVDLFFVEREVMASGYGARLWSHMMATARRLGARTVVIDSDPFAQGFYERMGATLVGTSSSPSTGRLLPRLRVTVLDPQRR